MRGGGGEVGGLLVGLGGGGFVDGGGLEFLQGDLGGPTGIDGYGGGHVGKLGSGGSGVERSTVVTEALLL